LDANIRSAVEFRISGASTSRHERWRVSGRTIGSRRRADVDP
jgi:hypothetical protein